MSGRWDTPGIYIFGDEVHDAEAEALGVPKMTKLPEGFHAADDDDADGENGETTDDDGLFAALAADAAIWQETDHPRQANGKFGSGGGAAPVAAIKTDKWKRVGGQLGSNPGGKFQDGQGQLWYSKRSKSEHHARNEVLAGKLYSLAQSSAVAPVLTDIQGKNGSATKWQNGVAKFDKSDADRTDAAANFITHCWLANWDAIGASYDNQGRINGKMTTLDVGGALEFRAQGGAKGKAFGPEVKEIDSMRNPALAPKAAAVFAAMTPAQLRASAEKVAAIPDAAVRDMVDAHGHGTDAQRARLADLLLARRDHIVSRMKEWTKH